MPSLDLSECADCCGIVDGCCDLGTTLAATLTDKVGSAVSLPDTMTFTPAGPLRWGSNTIAAPCPGPATAGMELRCNDDTWSLIGTSGLSNLVSVVTLVDCTSLTVIVEASFDNGLGCAGTFTITIQG